MGLIRTGLRRSVAALCGLGSVLSLGAARAAPDGGEEAPPAALSRERLLHAHEAAAADRLRRHASPGVSVPRGAWEAAQAGWDALSAPAGSTGARPPPPSLVWKELGPAPLDTTSKYFFAGANWSPAAGRVTAIAVHPTNKDVLYMGTAIGGVWKSTDGGASFVPLFDQGPSLAIGAITMDPGDPDTLWIGTGSAEPYSGPFGKGLLLTKDGGATWTRLGVSTFSGLSISRIALDPGLGHIYVTALFGSAGYGDACTAFNIAAEGQGLYRSADGGATWELLLSGSYDDVEVDASVTPRRLYADEVFVGPQRSLDGGATWSPVGGLPSGTERVQFTIAPSAPSTVYAGVGHQGEGSLWFSTDAGETFSEVPGVPSFCEGQCYFDDVVVVKPDDPTTVYLGGALCSVWKISDAMSPTPQISAVSLPNGDCGQDFSNWYLSYVHPDTHAMAFEPGDPETLYAGTDGGLSRTRDGGQSWEQRNDGVGTIQMYAVCADPNDPVRVYAGSQDNGAMVRKKDDLTWMGVSTGDGSGCAIDATNSANALVTVNYGYAIASTDGFEKKGVITFDTLKPGCQGLAGCGDRSGFIPPVAGHPTAPNTFFIGTHRLWRSAEGGKKGSWKAISEDLTGGAGSVVCYPDGAWTSNDYLTAIGLSAVDPKVMYTGSAGGVISATTDDGATWTRVASDVLPPRWTSGLAVDPVDPKVVAVAFSGFSAGTPATPGHVFLSSDAGATWAPSGLDIDVPVNALVGHPKLSGVLYAGTDYGVIASSDAGATWTKIGYGLPRSPVYSLSFRALTTSLIAGTHGRGAWEIAFTPSLGADPTALLFDAEVGSDPPARTLRLVNEERYGSVLLAQATTGDDWIALSADGSLAGGDTEVEVTVKVSAKGRAAGDYEGAITVTASAGAPATITVPVLLHVRQSGADGDDTKTDGDGCACTTAPEQRSTGAWWALAAGLVGVARPRSRRAIRRRRAP